MAEQGKINKNQEEQIDIRHYRVAFKYIRRQPEFLKNPAAFPKILGLIANELETVGLSKKTATEVHSIIDQWKCWIASKPSDTLVHPLEQEMHRMLQSLDTSLTDVQVALILQHLEIVGKDTASLWPTIAMEMKSMKLGTLSEAYWKRGFEQWVQAVKKQHISNPEQLNALQRRLVDFLKAANDLQEVVIEQFDEHGRVDVMELLANHCRTCLKTTKINETIFLFNKTDELTVAEKICACFGLSELHERDTLPKYVCKECHEKVCSAYEMRLTVQRTEDELRGLLREYAKGVVVEYLEETDGKHLELDDGAMVEMEVEDGAMDEHEDLQDAEVEVADTKETERPDDGAKEVQLDETKEANESTANYTNILYNSENPVFDKATPVQRVEVHKLASRKTSRSYKTCPICQNQYKSATTLKIHLRTHTNERPYVCDDCGKTFSQSANLAYHQKIHRNIRDFPCKRCDYRARNQNDLKVHFRTHSGARPYGCQMCLATFTTSSNLNKHMRCSHLGERNFKTCGKTFRTAGQCSVHRYVHNPSRHLQCNNCDYRTSLKSSMVTHRKRHTSAGDYYACDQCGKQFSTSSNRQQHNRAVHQRLAPYKCSTCNSTFTTKETARKHLVTHTLTKPYMCPVCKSPYSWYNGLQKHMRTMHPGVKIPSEKTLLNIRTANE